MTVAQHRRAALTLCGVLTAGLLLGCGGGDEPADDPTSTAPSATPTTGDSPTEEDTAAVEPASGKTIEGDQFSVTIPRGWQADREQIGVTYAYDPDSTATLVTGVTAVGEKSLDEAAALFLSSTSRQGVRHVGDTTLGGEPAFHLRGKPLSGYTFEAYGLWRNGQLVTLEFDLPGTDEERRALMDSVLATWQWT